MNIAAWIERRRTEETAIVEKAEQHAKEVRMFGVTVASLEAYAKTMRTRFRIVSHTMCLISDGQEAADIGDAELSRRTLNCAKWYLQKIVNSLPRLD